MDTEPPYQFGCDDEYYLVKQHFTFHTEDSEISLTL